ncbi:MFS transporter [Actinopolyspora mortivallis]|uniref:MFS transporter n=1 Tax=Actinopolyspora mortivallis TaxID=33906 RepID=UPI00267838BE
MNSTGNETITNRAGSPPTSDRLPVGKLLAFTLGGFLAIVTETMPAGLLPQIAHGLDIPAELAGQLITVYAIGSVVAAVPVIAATRGVSRRPLLLCAVGGLFVFNMVTALSSVYGVVLLARFAAGMAAGVVWGLLADYSRRLVSEHLQGRALALVSVGQPVALTCGVPLGTWLGSLFDWRGVFWIMSGLAAGLLVWIRALVPNLPGQAAQKRLPLHRVFVTPGVRPVLCVVFLWILAHNILYTYVAPFLNSAHLGGHVDVMLFVFGASAIVGIWATGMLVDPRLRLTTLVSLAGFAFAALVLGIAGQVPAAVTAGIVVWGVTFGGAPTLLQTANADAAGDGADVAQSMFVTVFNLAVAGGGVLGGLLVRTAGASALPWALFVLAALALATTAFAREHGFTPGHRTTHS